MNGPDSADAAHLDADPSFAGAVRAAYRSANAELLRHRLDLGVGLFVLATVGLLAFEREAYLARAADIAWLQAAQVALCAVALLLARWAPVRERLPSIGAVVTSALIVSVVVEDVLLGFTREITAVGLVALLASTAALFPWGWRAQLGVGLVTVATFVAAETLVFEGPPGMRAHLSLLVVATATVAGALLMDRYRFSAFQRAAGLEEASRENQEEAEISAALVEVGQTLASRVGQPDVFDRVNRLIVDLLGCDWSATVTRDPDRDVYRIVGIHGVSQEARDQADGLEFAEESLPLLRELERGEMIEIEDVSESRLMPARFFDRFQVSAALAAPIVLGNEVVGAVTNGYARHRGPFRRKHRRITTGIAQATAIAVENQRLFSDLARANRVKSDFVSTMSHELRTPVNVILGYARMLEEGDAGDLMPEQRDLVVRVRRSGMRLGELVDGILDLSRLESGAERLKLDWIEIDAFVATLDAEFREEVEGSGLVLEWVNHLGGRRMLTEGPRLRTIVRHLVQNAVKFTPRGEVRVELAQSSASLVVTVSDSGIGIAPEDVETIFDEFHQVDGTDSRRFGGAGLGLHIVRRLVDRLGGSVAVVSEPGRGSIFTVEVPAQFARARGA